ncbi:MAG: protein translocase subunit SecF [bacterium]|nr:protein translocase subunit SecF [bacterium]MXZ30133.1 protein translocase subunit SecF [Acidimicrobiia bacterium]MYB23856.1 protein translocase subunit SecF [Acidimicrobiia bacterium]MYE67299.1 protein translocase subunit SecF [Acidimicrobiia bacterium]MYJ13783.1 protein translocase subunit SecF [Acidimicrobiia bacterium]
MSERSSTVRAGLRRMYANQVNLDFERLWRRSVVLSMVVLAIAGGAWIFRGLNMGIEFEGGTFWEAPLGSHSVAEVREALATVGQADARIQELGGGVVRVRAEVAPGNTAEVAAVSAALAELGGISPNEISFSAVGPSWGAEITSKARLALIVFFVVIAVYIWVRMEWKMALSALVAVGHDILVTVGFYALFGFEVTPATVIAFLTILGYSLYDTLVVFDKIRGNARSRKDPYFEIVTRSVNEVFMRSVNTTVTSVLPVLSLLIIGRFALGAVTLQEFSIALLVGLLAGTYSSLFVASPLVAWLHVWVTGERPGQRQPSGQRRPAAAAARPKRSGSGPVGRSGVTTTRSHPARPAKKRRK